MFGWLRRNRPIEGRHECPHCGGWMETGMPADAARKIEAALRQREKSLGR